MGGTDVAALVDEADRVVLAYRTDRRRAVRADTRQRAADILNAIEVLATSGDLDGAAAVLTGFFVPLIENDHETIAIEWLDRLLARRSESLDPWRRFGLHEVAYVEAFLEGDTAVAGEHNAVLFEIAEATGAAELRARAYIARCRLGLRDEDAEAVEADAAQLARYAAGLEDQYFAAFAPHMLANLREMQGRPGEAVDMFTESSRLFATAGAHRMLMVEQFNLAACQMDLGNMVAARDGFARSAELMARLDDSHLEPELLSCLATLLTDEDDMPTAALLVGASESALERAGRVLYPSEQKSAQKNRSGLQQQLGEDQLARQIELGRQLGFAEAVQRAGL